MSSVIRPELLRSLADLDLAGALQEIAVLAGAGTIAYYLALAVYNLYFHPLAKIPSYSYLTPVNNWWSLYTSLWTHDRTFRLDAAHQRLGRLVRYAPNAVVINDVNALKPVMNNRLDKTPSGAAFATNRGVPNSFSAVVTAEAAGKRKGMMPQYATSNLLNWQPVFASHIAEMIKVIKGYGAQTPVDILSLGAHCNIDILGELVLDTQIGALADYANGKRNKVATAITLWPKRGFTMGNVHPVVWWCLARMPFASQRWKDLVHSDETLADFVGPRVHAARARGIPERPTLAHRLSTSVDSYTGEIWPVDHVISECVDHFLAGTESTTNTMSIFYYQLSIHPEIQAKLQAELDDAIPDPNTCIDLSTAQNLPYLNAVLRETMRLYPASPAAKMRVLGKDGLHVQGTFLPPGTVVGIQIHTTQRDTAIWGEDANEYRPDRFLVPLTPEQNLAFQPFSVGSRNCPGMNLALNDLRLMISMIVRNFHLTPAKETTPESMRIMDLETVYPKGHAVKLHFTPRA